MELTKREKRKLRLGKLGQESHEAQHEHEQRIEQHHRHEIQAKSSKSKHYAVWSTVVFIILAITVYSVYSMSKPGQYDDFAKCLSDKGAVMYGAMDWCKYTQAQKGMFGKSFKYINYHEFNELEGIKKTPTWVINGVWYENTQSFDTLAKVTGCRL